MFPPAGLQLFLSYAPVFSHKLFSGHAAAQQKKVLDASEAAPKAKRTAASFGSSSKKSAAHGTCFTLYLVSHRFRLELPASLCKA
jgi:hypothetical protein